MRNQVIYLDPPLEFARAELVLAAARLAGRCLQSPQSQSF
jgi:hypothetical protein